MFICWESYFLNISVLFVSRITTFVSAPLQTAANSLQLIADSPKLPNWVVV